MKVISEWIYVDERKHGTIRDGKAEENLAVSARFSFVFHKV